MVKSQLIPLQHNTEFYWLYQGSVVWDHQIGAFGKEEKLLKAIMISVSPR